MIKIKINGIVSCPILKSLKVDSGLRLFQNALSREYSIKENFFNSLWRMHIINRDIQK
jgi:hypothetical protein